MTPHPLALSDAQLKIVVGVAGQVHPRQRQAFLQDVADRLLVREAFNDRDVSAAATAALRRFTGPPSLR
jgi:hypothetical protein